MKIYLKNKETKEIISTFYNVINWTLDSVEYMSYDYRVATSCGENEYFTDKEVEDGNE